jgi:chromatin remodeling complex protein RSC6
LSSNRPRSELTKKLWDYIKKMDARTRKRGPRSMRTIRSDQFLTEEPVSMFEMTKLVSAIGEPSNP